MTAPDITGMRFGRLVVARRVANDKRGSARWLCNCDCGNTIEVTGGHLRSGYTRSCKCLRRETNIMKGRMYGAVNGRASRTIHGHTPTGKSSRTYRSWRSMKDRCTNSNHKYHEYYGGRGVKVCDRWLNSFSNFLADMDERPNGMTLDRYPDKDGNYEPGNCRWATRKEQANNRRAKSA